MINSAKKRFATPHLYQPVDDSLVLWIKGGIPSNTSAQVFDLSKFGNHGTIIGASWANTPLNHPCLNFDGVDDYVDVGDKVIFDFGTGNFTIEAWVKPNVIDTNVHRITQKETVSTNNQNLLRLEGTSGWRFFLATPAGNIDATGGVAVAGIWHHIGAVKNNKTGTLYTNGVQVATNTNNNFVSLDTAGTPFAIGGRSGEFFNGTIDEVRIYNRALSASEISQTYENTKHLYGR